MRKYFKLSGLICIALLMTGTTYAQTIPGIYIGVNDENTELQVPNPGIVNGEPIGTRFSTTASGGTEFLDGGGFASLWEIRMIELSEAADNVVFDSIGFTGNSGDLAIVTTLTDLAPGTYDVEFIFVGGFGFINLQYQTGFAADSTSPILDTNDFSMGGAPVSTRYTDVDVSFPAGGGTFDVFGSPIGSATVGPDGELKVYTDLRDVPLSANLSAFMGLSLVQTSTPGTTTTASEFTVFRGIQLTGELADSFESDDSRLTFNPGFTIGVFEAPVWLIFDAVLDPTPSSLSITVESSAGTPGLTVTTEAFNFTTDSYDEVDVRAETFNDDSIANIDISSGIADYVDADGNTRTRIGWRQTGFTIGFPWEARLDQVVWE